MEMASYITGLVDGEGSFMVSFSKRDKLKTGVEVRPAFSVSQHKRNREILFRLQEYFKCGSVRFDSHDDTYKYEVRSLDEIIKYIIPHFEQYPLRTTKQQDFERLKMICLLMRTRHHRSEVGIREIIGVAYQMNNLGARRYTKDTLLQTVSKMKV